MESNEFQTHISPSGNARRPKLFVGIALEEAARSDVREIARRLEERGLLARYEDPAKYHITLAFLGWVDPSLTEPISAAMRAIALRCKPFNLYIDKVGAFPNERRPRVVWAGCRQQPAEFRALAELIRETYQTQGFTFKDPAVAHVTICRIKAPKVPMPTISDFEPIEVPVGALTLYDSIQDKQTTRYVRLVSAPLGL